MHTRSAEAVKPLRPSGTKEFLCRTLQGPIPTFAEKALQPRSHRIQRGSVRPSEVQKASLPRFAEAPFGGLGETQRVRRLQFPTFKFMVEDDRRNELVADRAPLPKMEVSSTAVIR